MKNHKKSLEIETHAMLAAILLSGRLVNSASPPSESTIQEALDIAYKIFEKAAEQ